MVREGRREGKKNMTVKMIKSRERGGGGRKEKDNVRHKRNSKRKGSYMWKREEGK